MYFFVFLSLHWMFFSVWLLSSGSISTADGSALVKVGNTTVICGIKVVNDHKHSSLKTLFPWIWTECSLIFLVFLHPQELTNPTVEAPGKGYIGKYSTKVSSVDLKARYTKGDPNKQTLTRSILLSAQCGPAAVVFLSVSAGSTRRAGAGCQPVHRWCHWKVW